jgi:hypothetical protein
VLWWWYGMVPLTEVITMQNTQKGTRVLPCFLAPCSSFRSHFLHNPGSFRKAPAGSFSGNSLLLPGFSREFIVAHLLPGGTVAHSCKN